MPRYENTTIRKIKKEGSVEVVSKTTTLYDIIPESDNDTYVISQYGDRLDLLAYQYYGDTSLWWYIAKANDLKVMVIPTGTSLRIPGSTQYAKGK
jgi:phage tail protein X